MVHFRFICSISLHVFLIFSFFLSLNSSTCITRHFQYNVCYSSSSSSCIWSAKKRTSAEQSIYSTMRLIKETKERERIKGEREPGKKQLQFTFANYMYDIVLYRILVPCDHLFFSFTTQPEKLCSVQPRRIVCVREREMF